MKELALFVESIDNLSKSCLISEETMIKIGVSNGSLVKLTDSSTGAFVICQVGSSKQILDFQIKVSSDLLRELNFGGIELKIGPNTEKSEISSQNLKEPVKKSIFSPLPKLQKLNVPPPPQKQFGVPQPPPKPRTTPPPPQQQFSVPQPPPKPRTAPPAPQQQFGLPQLPPKPRTAPLSPQQPPDVPPPPHTPVPETVPEPYPNRIDTIELSSQKSGSMILRVKKTTGCEGRVKINPLTLKQLLLAHGMLIAWEDPLTRSSGSARITEADNIPLGEINMDSDTAEDTNIQAEEIVVFSTEPPLIHQEIITLEIIPQPGLRGNMIVNPRNAEILQVNEGDVVQFEDNLTGAVGAAKLRIQENLENTKIIIDEELLEASGIGSFEVEIKKNLRQIIPLQSIELGIAPITGENVWEVISAARQNINSIKAWLSGYVIFKGIKLRWKVANVGCEVLNTTPDLIGDVFALINQNTTITLQPMGLVTFNAILVIDISRSMMARDVEVKNIGSAIEGIKAAMHAKEIQEFLGKFKPGINVPRRFSAAFAAILFLSEKVGRGFGEKVSIIRFADEAQALYFSGNLPYMDSSSGEKDILEAAAKMIVEQIGNAYGQATNMGQAMLKAQEILKIFELEEKGGESLPTMLILLTDGSATDGDKFFESIQTFSQNPNVVVYIIGLGNPDDKQMKHAANLCGGEYFKPQDAGELLVWYSKRARDLQVKLKGTKE